MSEEIRVRLGVNERTLRAADAPVLIGSGANASLRSSNPMVAAHHATLELTGATWTVRSQGGARLYLAGQPVPEARVGGGLQLMLGDPETGEELTVATGEVDLPVSRVTTRSGTLPEPPANRLRGGLAASTGRQRPPVGGVGNAATVMGTVDGVALRVHHGSSQQEFRPGQIVKIGRNASNDVVLNNPLVSGFHAEVRFGASGWELDDASSKRGTYHDGKKVSHLELAGVTSVSFAEEGSGEKVMFVAPGEAKVAPKSSGGKASKTPIAIGVGVLVVVALIVAGFVLTRPDDKKETIVGRPDPKPPPEFDIPTLARGTVKLIASVDGADSASIGSGTIISDDGLILTNAHVAAPSTLSTAPDPDEILVLVNERGDDRAVEPKYYAEVVAADGQRDLAVVKITQTLGGNEVTPEDLSPLTVIPTGENPSLGTEVEILGYPGVAQSKSVTLTRGVVGSYTEGLAGPKQLINTDAKIEHGNSGGLAADKSGAIVGIPTRYDCATAIGPNGEVVEDCESGKQNQLTAVEMAEPLIAAAKAGTEYRVDA